MSRIRCSRTVSAQIAHSALSRLFECKVSDDNNCRALPRPPFHWNQRDRVCHANYMSERGCLGVNGNCSIKRGWYI